MIQEDSLISQFSTFFMSGVVVQAAQLSGWGYG